MLREGVCNNDDSGGEEACASFPLVPAQDLMMLNSKGVSAIQSNDITALNK